MCRSRSRTATRTRQWTLAALASAIVMAGGPSALAVTLHATDDTFIDLVATDANFGSNPNLIIQNVDMANKSGERRVFARFDLGALPDDAEVAKATLRLWVDTVGVPGTVELHRVLSAWNEKDLTADSAPASSLLDTFSVSPADEGNFVAVDITDLMQDWRDGSAENFGISLAGDTDSVKVRLNSKENSQSSHPMEIEVVLADASAETTCGDDEVLLGDGSCLAVPAQGFFEGYEIVSATTILGPSTTGSDAFVSCPTGKKVLGGGVFSAQRLAINTKVSAPEGSGGGWFAFVEKLSAPDSTVSFDVFAICAFASD